MISFIDFPEDVIEPTAPTGSADRQTKVQRGARLCISPKVVLYGARVDTGAIRGAARTHCRLNCGSV
jgi:hypothetical protein